MRTRRRFLQACVTLSGVALTGCSDSGDGTSTATATETTTPVAGQTLETRSHEFVTGLAGGEYDRLLAEYPFTEELAARLDAARLEQIWTEQTSTVGQFVEVTAVESGQVQGYYVVDVVVRFTAGQRIVRLSYTGDGEMAGLFVRRPAPDASYSPPEYVDQSTFEEHDRTVRATDDCSLPAKLTLPSGEQSIPGVVLVHGSGPNDMDETIGPNKPFTDLAWGLASRGVAVLRYDKRTSACDVDLATLTLDEKVTDDALAALDVLREHSRVDSSRTVVVGHSIGAMVAPRIADRDDSIAGAVMLAANARPLLDVIPAQYEYLARLDGKLDDREAAQLEEIERIVDRVRDLSIEDGEVVFGLGGRPFWRTVQAYDQVATAEALEVPLAIFQGERDYQVTIDDFERWRAALGDREAVTFHSYPDLNHLFMPGEGQSAPAEYFRPNNVARAVVEDVADRVLAMTETGT
ncbi:alpha/beta fold hydrolase [Halorhabdus amylolytica]|uniref:alpha/beta fold hydrolase n=1 Tax=Halorhabdus amylolytica TaxID=2559573 RepID=UPI00145A9FC0|nr:alpha/beta fold hydrolase [Halorhabdus amylolytica]